MSKYLTVDDTDYFPTGTVPTESLILRASAIIDGYCKRSISLSTYTERIPLTNGRGHLSYYPVMNVEEVKGRAAYGWTGDNFFGVSEFETVDPNYVDIDRRIGTVMCGGNLFGSPYTELEVTYSSGWDPIPEKVKVACGLLVGQVASNPNSNVKAKKDFDFSIEYFGSGMVNPEIADLLSEYKIRSFR
ncbi:hypothetical protein [Paenibacillus aceti]|uniref:Uncharacterized protein n=1 Tax=Paenibacillus aceti TaxID=1820010 RepID=A0ABQ1VQF4_9BACL|nr:hypothetical protein [Paenibacillus aceti]GGF86864.1 hypothetical protein GCM10010913_05430 [Paenibacillus aceti]